MLTRTQSVEPAVFSSTNSIQSNLSGFNALLKSKSKLQDEFFKSQREVSSDLTYLTLLLGSKTRRRTQKTISSTNSANSLAAGSSKPAKLTRSNTQEYVRHYPRSICPG